MSVTIREVSINDVNTFTTLMQQVFEESEYMLYDPGEYMPSFENAISKMEEVITSPHLAIFVAQKDELLVGYLTVKTKTLHRIAHIAEISIGVLRQYQNAGIGYQLLQQCIEWCRQHEVTRLSLSVVTENKAAVQFYKRAGFKIEGELRHTLKIDNRYYNSFVMAYLLSSSSNPTP